MLFSEYAQGLYPYCSSGTEEARFFVALIGNFIQDAAMDACKVLKRKPDTQYRYILGKRQLQTKDAQYIYKHRNMGKFADWLDEQMEESDSEDAVSDWLLSKEITLDDAGVADTCAKLFETIILAIITQNSSPTDNLDTPRYDFELLDSIKTRIKKLPRPPAVPVPEEAAPEENDYIDELYRAYGQAVGTDAFRGSDLDAYPEYRDDLDERRIDFYAAETIRRGVLELKRAGLSGQYEILKGETYSGVKDTERMRFLNGYERMLAVMTQAVGLPVTDYILCESPYWISGRIKKGVCHQLVVDGKLRWVKTIK